MLRAMMLALLLAPVFAHAERPARLWIVHAEYMAGEVPAWGTPSQVEPDARAVGACGWACEPSDGRIARVTMHFTRPGAAQKAIRHLQRTGHVLSVWREQEPARERAPSRIWLRE